MKGFVRFATGFLFAWCFIASAAPQGNSFTYQGRLTDGSLPANGSFDLTFALFDNSSGGNGVGPTLTNSATPVSDGLFVATLDFGANIFIGDARWLEIGVRTNAGGGAFFILAPRQPISAAPYALFALNAATNIVLVDSNNANAAFLTAISNQTVGVVATALTGATNSALFTNQLPVNAVQRGAIPDGVTDNTTILSNLFNRGGTVYLPPGRYMISNNLVVLPSSPAISIISDGAELIGASTIAGFKTLLALNPASCKVRGLTITDGRSFTNINSRSVFLNAVGFAQIDNCHFNNSRGPAIVVSGDSNIYLRSNHWRVASCTFSNYYGGVWAQGFNTSEYGVISDCQGANGIAFGIKAQSANCVGDGNSFTGPGGDYDYLTATGIGLWLVSDNSRLHDKITGHFAHWKYGVWIEGCGTMLTLDHLITSGEFNMFKDCNGIQIIGGLYEAYQTNLLFSCTNTTVIGVDFRGQMMGWTNLNGTANYTGNGNRQNNVELPAYGNGGGWTNIPTTAIVGGLSTNIPVMGLGNLTNTLVFSNGVLIRVQ